MSHYLVDLFDTTAISLTPVRTGPPIVAVTEPLNGQTLINGSFVIRLPDTSALVDPSTGKPSVPQNAGDLLAKKYQGLLSYFAGYANVAYDDLLDTSGINMAAAGLAGTFGKRSAIALNPGATLTSNVVTLTDTPANAIFTWEVFQYIDADPSADRMTRTYQELPTTNTYTTAQLSFDNGSNFNTVTDMAVFNIPSGQQGTQLVVKITNASASRLHIGSWAVVY